MRNDWTLTPSEMALFVAALTFVAGNRRLMFVSGRLVS
jgi:hypothetical protein